MKAAVYRTYGPPEVVKIEDVPTPRPRTGEIQIRICATTVNRTDTTFRGAAHAFNRLVSGLLKPKHIILGNEFAGEVTAIGPHVREFQPGDRVFGYNDATFGAHAEYLKISERGAIAKIPDSLTFMEVVALTEGAHYALSNIRAAKVKAGDNVLVNGATGAIGSSAVQLLKFFGARVTAVCPTRHMAIVDALGADHVISYEDEDFTQLPSRFDFIFDAVGKSSYGKCKPLMKPQAKFISTEPGKNGENMYLAMLHKFSGRKRVLFPIPTISKDDVNFLAELAEKGAFKPLIDRTYGLDDIVEAHRYVEAGQKLGNVIILPYPQKA